MKSSNLRKPETSVTTGCVCGSQLATSWPALHARRRRLTRERRAVRHLVALALAAELVDDGDLAGTRRRDEVALLLVRHGLDVVKRITPVALDLDAVRRGRRATPRRRCGTCAS